MHSQQPWPYPRFVAHRGGGKIAPENTLGGMRAAYDCGYKMVEFDVKLTRDNIPVLLHDSDLERTTNGHGPAIQYSLAELERLDAGSWHSQAYAAEPIPTLRAIAAYTIKHSIASNIEIKPSPGVETLTGALVAREALQLWEHAQIPPLLSSFSATALRAAKSEAPYLPRGFITDALPTDWHALLTELGCVSIHLRHTAVTQDVISQVQDAGFRLAVWTVNEPARAQELLAWGVDAIITDIIDRISPV